MKNDHRCYLCGAAGKMTEDHLPPKSFFPEDQRIGLIVAPCCEKCRVPQSQDDALFRVFAGSADGGSAAQHHIVPEMIKSLEGDRRMNAKVMSMIRRIMDGGEERLAVGLEAGFVIDYIKRMTKGLLSQGYPHYDYYCDHFKIFPYRDSNADVVQSILPFLSYTATGKKVFEAWHLVRDEPKDKVGGIWVLAFYNTVAFVCCHGWSNGSGLAKGN